MRRFRLWAAMLLGWVVLAAAAPADGPAAYAARVAVTPAGGHILQRLDLPPAILAAAEASGLGDLRLFDRAGRPVPIAPADPVPAIRRDALRPLPILAPADTLKVTDLSVRLDTAGQPRLATVAGTPMQGAGTATVGVLLDTRALAGEAQRLALDADLPQGQPVTFTAEASDDLKTWTPLGQATAYRAPDAAAATVALRLDGRSLAGSYLRVTWGAGARLIAPVVVRGATVETRSSAGAPVLLAADAPAPAERGAVTFAMPFATPVVSLAVLPRGSDTAVPVRVLGRDNAEQPWAVLGAGLATAGSTIPLSGASARTVRIEPTSGGGFTAAPELRLGVAPSAILFLATGQPPYTLAAGRAGGTDYALSRATLGPGLGSPGLARAASPPVRLRLVAPDGGGGRRTLILWAVLLAAVAALGWMAWLVWKRLPPPPAEA